MSEEGTKWITAVSASTDASVAVTSTITPPTAGSSGYVSLARNNGLSPKWLEFRVYGVGSNDHAVTIRLEGVAPNQATVPLYQGQVLAAVTAALNSSVTGVATSVPANTDYWADTMAVVTGVTAGQEVRITAVDATPSVCLVDVSGYSLVRFSTARGSATSVSVEYRLIWDRNTP